MLNDNERKKIIEKIRQGKTNYRIWKETHHSVNTIQSVREALEETEKNQTLRENGRFDSPIDMIKGFIADLDTLIQTEKLNDKEEKVWEKRLEQLREIIREEVDDRIPKERDRIPKEREDAVNKRDQEWNISIKQNYVKKEVVTSLESEIRKRDETIKEQENYIITRLEKDVGVDIRQLNYEREVINAEKTSLSTDIIPIVKQQLSDSHKLFFAAVEKQKANEVREKQLDEREEKIKKREDESKVNNK